MCPHIFTIEGEKKFAMAKTAYKSDIEMYPSPIREFISVSVIFVELDSSRLIASVTNRALIDAVWNAVKSSINAFYRLIHGKKPRKMAGFKLFTEETLEINNFRRFGF